MKITKFTFILSFISLNSCILFAQQTATFGKGNTKGVNVSSSSTAETGIKTLQSSGYLPNQGASSRFLSQATLGPNLTLINNVASVGKENWLDTQLNMSNSFGIQTYLTSLHQLKVDSMLRYNPSGGYTLQNTNVDNWHFDVSWFQGSMTAPDVLRWRVALALSEIFVVSRISGFDGNPYALASYYDVLLNNSFENYRTLLDKITYHPAMADYLTFMNNHATNNAKKIYPDENYAREIMQLFSIGLYKLNIDGTEMKDANNTSIPTYNNNDIAALAKVFTGLSWGDARYLGDDDKDKWSYTKRLKFFPKDSMEYYRGYYMPQIYNGHEPGSKTFLSSTIPNRDILLGEQDIQDALNIIFNHPNVAPFISRRLIQRLVTSNPSPAYIQRVATIFNNNGSGVRGDLKAVVRAIFLDPEACDCEADKINTANGMLKEPFVRYMNLMRGVKLTTQNGVFRNTMNYLYDKLEQIPLSSPTVFNFFQPDYSPDGDLKNTGKYAPEFQLLSSQTLTGYFNIMNNFLINDDPVEFWYLFDNETYKPDQDSHFDLAADYLLSRNDKLPQLLDKYNLILAHGSITKTNMDIIRKAIEQMPYSETGGIPDENEAYRRVRIALFLIMTSPDYLINR
jgi:uncharacterized protein (DUF1800 family)